MCIQQMNVLLYTTVGYSEKYLELLDLYCDSLCYTHRQVKHLLVICDESFQSRVIDILSKYAFFKWYIHAVEDSSTPVAASMHKLHIFDFKEIHRFSIALYVDADCLFTDSYEVFLNNPIQDGKLYVYQEGKKFNCQTYGLWTMQGSNAVGWFNDKQLERLEKLGKKPFNAGLFMFRITPLMESHFQGLNKFIEDYKGEHFYEQSFMNTWFSFNNLTDNSIFHRRNVAMMTTHNQFEDYTTLHHVILHFNMKAAMGVEKHALMTRYITMLKTKQPPRMYPSRALMAEVLIPEGAKVVQLGGVEDGTFADSLVSNNPSKLHLIDSWSSFSSSSKLPAIVLDKFRFNPNVNVFQGDAVTYFKTIQKASQEVLILSEDNVTTDILEKAYTCIRKYGLILCTVHRSDAVFSFCEKYEIHIIAQSGNVYALRVH